MNKNINRLYSRSKYYNEHDVRKSYNISDVLNMKNVPNQIEPSSILSIIKKSYIIGDNTIIKGIKKTPWMHDFSENSNDFTTLDLPHHKKLSLSTEIIASKFKCLLLEEAKEFCSGKNVVGILLSGGMDSRVVAGIIRELQDRKEFNGSVVALTWGLENTRDVVYARSIVKKYQWDHIHYPLDSELLSKNIDLVAEMGAEVSPLHMHAMLNISNEKGIDGILAGSYGDSVGRGEFSGKKLTELTGQLQSDYNQFGFLYNSVNTKHNDTLQNEINNYRKNFPRNEPWQQCEVEQQCHYMRRQLSSCMDVIDNKVPLYQMFTSPSVFGFIWSLDSKCRNNFIYEELLKLLPGNLLDIPWARDGKIYPSRGNSIDNIPSSHNKYGLWLRSDCYDVVSLALNNGALERLNLFNPKSLDIWKKSWYKCDALKGDKIDERISWMASLAIFCEKHSVQACSSSLNESEIKSHYEARKGQLYSWTYRKARDILKK